MGNYYGCAPHTSSLSQNRARVGQVRAGGETRDVAGAFRVVGEDEVHAGVGQWAGNLNL